MGFYGAYGAASTRNDEWSGGVRRYRRSLVGGGEGRSTQYDQLHYQTIRDYIDVITEYSTKVYR